MIKRIAEMLSYMRPAYSKMDETFITKYIEPVGVFDDEAGNLIKIIGDDPEVMWSCHTDTVHMVSGTQSVKTKGQYITLNEKDSNCLGADDTAGVWLMLELIHAGKEGLYVFHRAEEDGGKGSSYIQRYTPELLKGIKYAIALDRKGTRDVITHQMSGRCCSDEFAESLAEGLDMKFRPDDGGTFTDTANYTDIVGECTNLSVGYDNQHSAKEVLDVAFLINLRKHLLELDYTKLVSKRKAGEVDPDDINRWSRLWNTSTGVTSSVKHHVVNIEDTWNRCETLEDFALEYPDIVAKLMNDYGITAENVRDEVYIQTGELS